MKKYVCGCVTTHGLLKQNIKEFDESQQSDVTCQIMASELSVFSKDQI